MTGMGCEFPVMLRLGGLNMMGAEYAAIGSSFDHSFHRCVFELCC